MAESDRRLYGNLQSCFGTGDFRRMVAESREGMGISPQNGAKVNNLTKGSRKVFRVGLTDRRRPGTFDKFDFVISRPGRDGHEDDFER